MIGIPLIRVASGESDQYIRPKGRYAMPRPAPASNAVRKPIYIRNDNEAGQSSLQRYWVYDDEEFADVGLKWADVAPKTFWNKDRAAIVSTAESDLVLVGLRHDEEGSRISFLSSSLSNRPMFYHKVTHSNFHICA